ncbi:MAG: hypothetical protein WCK27_03915 [Verrucomicrobiota bacterium]
MSFGLPFVVGGRLAVAQTGKEWLPPTPIGQQWKLICFAARLPDRAKALQSDSLQTVCRR